MGDGDIVLTPKIYFSVSKEYSKDIAKISEEKTKDRTFSTFISKAIVEKYQKDNQTTLPNFQTPQLELDFLPRINEPRARNHLTQLPDKDVGRLWDMLRYNKRVVDEYVD